MQLTLTVRVFYPKKSFVFGPTILFAQVSSISWKTLCMVHQTQQATFKLRDTWNCNLNDPHISKQSTASVFFLKQKPVLKESIFFITKKVNSESN